MNIFIILYKLYILIQLIILTFNCRKTNHFIVIDLNVVMIKYFQFIFLGEYFIKEVENYYYNSAEREWERLERHRIEFDITKRYLDKYLNKKSKILDAGGGPGRYSIYLAKHGHDVTLLDLSLENIKLGIKKSREEGIELNDYIHGNVLELSEKVVSVTGQKYNEGLATSLELTQVNDQYLNTLRDYTTAMVEVLNAKITIDLLMNRI